MSSLLVDMICQRVSCPRLSEPAPNAGVLKAIYRSALRAPDHMLLRPWRYLVVRGEARKKLGELFYRAAYAEDQNISLTRKDKYFSMPYRAPMILIGVSSNVEHPKVPIEEQMISCGVGMGYMLLGLQAEGFGGFWRTGPMASSSIVKQGLGIAEHETLVGFLYMGTPQGKAKPLQDLDTSDYFHDWNG